MVSDEVNIIVKVDTEEATLEVDNFRNEVDKLATRWQRIKLTIQTESRKLLYSLAGFVNLAENIFRKFGVSFGALGDALLNIIQAVIMSVIAMQWAYAASGPIGWAMMALSIVSLAFALDAELKAAFGVDEAKRLSQDAVSVLSSAKSILTPWGY